MKVSMDTFFNQQSNHGIMVDDGGFDNEDAISSSSSLSNVSSNSSEFMEDATSSSGSSPSSVLKSDHKNGATTTKTTNGGGGRGALYEMDSLMQQLPFKRGLSKHYQGKSQSFTSLCDVRCLEDLPKPSRKKLKSCKSYGGGLSEAAHRVSLPTKVISKKGSSSSRGSWSSISGAKRPPVAPQRNNTSLFKPLFA